MSVPFDDRGLTLGDGLFETILWNGTELVGFDAHLARMTAGCADLGLPAPVSDDLLHAAKRALAEDGLAATRSAVRLSWTAGSGGRGLTRPDPLKPRLFATAAPAPRPETPARLITARTRRNELSPASRLKTLSYLDNVLARREAEQAGASEALMLNGAGEVACAAAANLFWLSGGALFTPAREAGVLAGIVRGEVMAAARAAGVTVQEVRAGPEALRGAAVFLTNSLIGIRPVSSIDGVGLPQQPVQVTDWLRRGRR